MPHEGKVARGRVYQRRSLAERFWPRVDKNGPEVRPGLGSCHIWTGSIAGNGYGSVRADDGKTLTAHQAAWLLAGRELPTDGRELSHSCDVRACCNVEHLAAETHRENIGQAVSRKRMLPQFAPERMVRGSRHSQAKLDESEVLEIRRRANDGDSHAELASRFRVTTVTIANVVQRKFWRHVS